MSEDSICLKCKHYICWSENPNADAGGSYTVTYEECGEGYDSNLGTEYGCFNYEEKK